MHKRHSVIPGGCTRGPAPPFQFCPGCYANRKRSANYKGCRYYVSAPPIPRLDWTTIMKRTATSAPDPKNRKWACPDAWIFEAYPNLAQGLCDPWWDEGKPRTPWNFKFNYGTGGCTVTINSPDEKLVLFTAAPSLEEAMELVEAALESGTAAWRKSKF